MRLLAVLAFLPACTSFANVRSARVRPGTTIDVQSSFASSPGDAAGWLLGNNIDCTHECRGGILGGELGISHGFARPPRPFTLGAGVMGIVPYVEGYVQLKGGDRPAGIGARIGIPMSGDATIGQAYARFDIPVGGSHRLMWNPAIFHVSGRTPSSSARFTALVNGVGLELGDENPFTPSLAFVVAHAEHDFFGGREGPAVSGFVVVGMRAAFGRKQPDVASSARSARAVQQSSKE